MLLSPNDPESSSKHHKPQYKHDFWITHDAILHRQPSLATSFLFSCTGESRTNTDPYLPHSLQPLKPSSPAPAPHLGPLCSFSCPLSSSSLRPRAKQLDLMPTQAPHRERRVRFRNSKHLRARANTEGHSTQRARSACSDRTSFLPFLCLSLSTTSITPRWVDNLLFLWWGMDAWLTPLSFFLFLLFSLLPFSPLLLGFTH